MSGSLALAAAVVLGFGSAAFGVIGTVAELTVKEIDKDRHPILRTIGEVFSRTLQNTAAVVALLVLGSLFVTNPFAIGAMAIIGAVMVLTPVINGVVQHTNNKKLKDVTQMADQVASGTAKTINTAVLTVAVFMSSGILAAVAAGIGLSALSIATYKKV